MDLSGQTAIRGYNGRVLSQKLAALSSIVRVGIALSAIGQAYAGIQMPSSAWLFFAALCVCEAGLHRATKARLAENCRVMAPTSSVG